MASRKKGKKTKGQTVNLTEFLSSGPPVVPLKSTSWADDPDDEYDNGSYMPKSSKEPVVLPTAPRAARGPGFEDENIPHNPPYVAYISNLPYDVVDEDLEELFQDMMISNIRLPKDSTKARGYGYVEFEDRDGLIAALSMANTMVKTRRVRIDVSNSSNEERRGGGRMGMNRDNNRRDGYDDPERTSGDWRSKPREEPSGGNDDRFRSRGNFDRREDRETSESDNKPGGWREGDRSTSSFNDKRSYRGGGDDDRRGGGGGGGRFTNDERRGGGGFRNDNDWSRDRNTSSFGPRRDGPRDEPRDEPSAEPRERQKLVLAKRTKPVEPIIVIKPEEAEIIEEPVKEIKPAPKKPAADIFGAAKPVDTTAREREIEERLAKSNAEKAAKEETTENKTTWGRRNGEGGGRVDREKEKPRPTWRSDEDRNDRRQDNRHTDRHDRRQDNRGSSGRSDNRGDSRNDSKVNTRHGAGQSRGGGGGGRNNDSRGPPEKERRERERDSHKEDPPMPKATDQPTVNFVASNKFSMLPEDVDPDIDA